MSNPAAPLEKAVEEARKALDESHECSSDHEVCCLCGAHGVHDALFNLLAALDADRGEAEAALREIAGDAFACDCGELVLDDEDRTRTQYTCPGCVARAALAGQEVGRG